MRKINFYFIVVAVSAMALSMSSCTKDLEDDVDQLKKEVAENKSAIAALDQAIKKGALITDVKPITGGFTITFSDGKTIDVLNGINGAPGAGGPAGEAGEPGFAPVLGVDADGYWTVIKTLGGAPEKILGSDGQPVKAKGTDGSDAVVEVTPDGFLKIGETVTTINTSSVVINTVANTAIITMWDTTANKMVTFTVSLVGEGNMVASLRTPLSKGYKLTLVQGTVTTTLLDGPFAGLKKDDVLIQGVLPVIINPSNAAVIPANFVLENQKGEALNIKFTAAKKGFEGNIDTRSTTTGGVTALTIDSKTTDGKLVVNGTDYALKYTFAGENAIYSTYDYDVKLGAPADLTGTAAKSVSKKIGSVITFNGDVAKGALYGITPEQIYMQKIGLSTADAVYAQYLEITENTPFKLKQMLRL